MRAEQEPTAIEQILAEHGARQRRLLTELHELILISGQPLAIEKLQEQLLSRTMSVLAADAGCIHHYDETAQSLRLVVHCGLSADGQKRLEHLPPAWLVEDRIPRTVTDIASDPGAPSVLRSSGFRTYLGMPITLLGHVTGVLSMLWVDARMFSVEEIALFHTIVDQVAIVIENVRLRQRGEESAALKERRRLARDLHDSVTQSLYSLVLAAETASSRLKQGKLDLLAASLHQQAQCARQALREMRLLLFELRLASLDEMDLAEALHIRLDAVERKAGIKVDAKIDNLADLPKAVEKELYCITMEALNNALKHARAGSLHVSLAKRGRAVELDVADDGCGFAPYAAKLGGLGLHSMAERAERLGGELTITSAPGQGARVHLHVPDVLAAQTDANVKPDDQARETTDARG